jgi:hypothetical protein
MSSSSYDFVNAAGRGNSDPANAEMRPAARKSEKM